MSGLTIERLSEASGLDEDRIREYQRESLLPAPEPTPWGSEEYPEETLARLPLIHRAREIGLSWTELRELVELWFGPAGDPEQAKAWLERRIAEVDQEIAQLSRTRAVLARLSEDRPSGEDPRPSAG
jgi:DNA-binding transcriptional MerR regulator